MQRDLGHQKFNDLVRYAYDQGITYFDTADSYGTHTWVAEAIKGLPREKLYIQSKIISMGGFGGMGRGGFGGFGGIQKRSRLLDRFRKELDMDYIDTVLLHSRYLRGVGTTQTKRLRRWPGGSQAEKDHSRSWRLVPSLPATTKAASLSWVDVNLVRVNPQASTSLAGNVRLRPQQRIRFSRRSGTAENHEEK